MYLNQKCYQFVIFAIGITCCCLLLFAIFCQIGTTSDSWQYFSAASSLWSKGAMLNRDGTYFTHWPPLYPFLLSFFKDKLIGAKVINVIALGGTYFSMTTLSHQFLKDQVLKICFALTLGFGTPLLMMYAFAWSEGIFMLLLSLAFLFFHRYLDCPSVLNLYMLVASSAFFCLDRYLGAFFVGSFAIALLISPQKKLHHVTLYVLLSILPLSIWLVYTYSVQDGHFNVLVEDLFSQFFRNLMSDRYYDIFATWFLPQSLVYGHGKLFTISFLLAIGLLIYGQRSGRQADQWHLHFKTTLLIVLSYFLFLNIVDYTKFFTQQSVPYSYLSDFERFLALVYPCLLLSIFYLIEGAIQSKQPSMKTAVYILISFWLIYPVARSIKNAVAWHDQNCNIELDEG